MEYYLNDLNSIKSNNFAEKTFYKKLIELISIKSTKNKYNAFILYAVIKAMKRLHFNTFFK